MDPSEADEGGEPERRHEGDSTVGNAAEQGIMRAQMADQKPSKQCADAGAKRNRDAADRKGEQDADNAA